MLMSVDLCLVIFFEPRELGLTVAFGSVFHHLLQEMEYVD